MILGAIIGDIIGVPYEFRYNRQKSKDFPLFNGKNHISDDSVLTVAVMEWLMTNDSLEDIILKWCKKYPKAGYGGMFRKWLANPDRKPYNSLGNGSAMRVSPVAWYALQSNKCKLLAKKSAEITHNHPEGIKGAQAVAMCIYLALNDYSKDAIKDYIEKVYEYDLSRKLDDIRKTYKFDSTCPGSVPEAIICFLESTSYEDAIRNAVSLGGDADTQAAIAGSIAEAYYGGVPQNIINNAEKYIPKDMMEIITKFSNFCNEGIREEIYNKE